MHPVTTSTQSFIARLQAHTEKQLAFKYANKRIQPGYHVTEIKAATFKSLDCGANPQQWHETIFQLWDVAEEPERGHMTVKKFLGIYNKVNADLGLDENAEVKFECGDAHSPAVTYTFGEMDVEGNLVVVSLAAVRATCKPRDLWWMARDAAQGAAQSNACCAPNSAPVNFIRLDELTTGVSAVANAVCCTAH